MQTAFTLPRNEDFFQKYATLVPVLKRLGVFAQIINGLTEFGILNAILLAHIAGLFGAFAGPLAFVAAVFGVLILEMGQRTFLPYSARAVLHRRFQGLDGWMSGFVFAITLCLFGASLYLSFNGSKDLVEAVAPPPVLFDTDAADVDKSSAKDEAAQAFRADSAEVAARYAGLVAAARNTTAAQTAIHRANIERLTVKERKARQSYASQRNNETAQILGLEAALAARLAELEGQKAAEVHAAKSHRAAALDVAEAARQAVDEKNEVAAAESRAKVQGYGSGLGWFTVVFHLVLLLSIVLDEMHKRGSGIEVRAQPNQYHFSESIGAKFAHTLSDKWNYHARTWIQGWADKTPPPPRPTVPPTLYELADWKPQRMTLPTVPPELLEGLQTNGNGHHNGAANGKASGTAAQNLTANGTRVSATIPAKDAATAPDTAAENERKFAIALTAYRKRTGQDKILEADAPANEPPDIPAVPAEVERRGPYPALPIGARVRFRWRNTTGNRSEGVGTVTASIYNGYYILGDDGKSHYANNHAVTAEPMPEAEPPKAQPLNGSVNNGGGFAKICAHCGKDYTAKVGWQKFCCETCKLAFHEAKHGQPFKPKSYHKRQPVTA